MNDYREFKPETIAGIKRLAKKIKRSEGLAHSAALDRAAKQAGYQNYKHAFNTLEKINADSE